MNSAFNNVDLRTYICLIQRIILLVIIIICSVYHYAEAQNLKGKWMIGAKILDLQINKSDKSIEMEPSFGRYITDKIGLGLTGAFNYGQSGNQKPLMKYDFGTFTKYYFASLGKESYLFTGINLLYGKSQFIAPDGIH